MAADSTAGTNETGPNETGPNKTGPNKAEPIEKEAGEAARPGAPEPKPRRSVSRWRSKAMNVLVALLLALALVGVTTQTWASVHLPQTEVVQKDIVLKGSQLLPAVTAFALVGAAAALAMSIASTLFARICAALIALAGVAVVINVAGNLANPLASAQNEIGKATGMLGATDAHMTTTPLGWAALVLGALLALAGVFALCNVGGWKKMGGRSSRFERPGTRASLAAKGRGGESVSENRKDRAIDSWDRLTRGDDPTS